MAEYIIYAGVNGAGKSTLYNFQSLNTIQRINADKILIEQKGDWRNFNDVAKASKEAVRRIHECFQNKKSFCQETTLTGKSILKNINTAKTLGYKITMYYIGVDSVEIAKERVQYRVENGGHGIPKEDIEKRYIESLQNLLLTISQCDMVFIYDNTVKAINVATINKNKIDISEYCPKWVSDILKKYTLVNNLLQSKDKKMEINNMLNLKPKENKATNNILRNKNKLNKTRKNNHDLER